MNIKQQKTLPQTNCVNAHDSTENQERNVNAQRWKWIQMRQQISIAPSFGLDRFYFSGCHIFVSTVECPKCWQPHYAALLRGTRVWLCVCECFDYFDYELSSVIVCVARTQLFACAFRLFWFWRMKMQKILREQWILLMFDSFFSNPWTQTIMFKIFHFQLLLNPYWCRLYISRTLLMNSTCGKTRTKKFGNGESQSAAVREKIPIRMVWLWWLITNGAPPSKTQPLTAGGLLAQSTSGRTNSSAPSPINRRHSSWPIADVFTHCKMSEKFSSSSVSFYIQHK